MRKLLLALVLCLPVAIPATGQQISTVGPVSPCAAFGTTSGTCVQGAGALGTPSSGTATNFTGLPLTTGVTGVLPTANGGTNNSAACTVVGRTSWTPTLSTDGTPGTPAYANQLGNYVVDSSCMVHAVFRIILSGWTGSPTGNVSIASLPKTSANVSSYAGVCNLSEYSGLSLTALYTQVSARVTFNGTIAELFQSGSTQVAAQITTGIIGTTPSLYGECDYLQ